MAILPALAMTVAAGCGRDAPESREPPAPQEAAPAATAHAVTRKDLEGLTYRSEFSGPGSITLLDGVYQEPPAPESATVTLVLLTEHVAFGDLDGDGVEDAAAVLETDPGGSGVFFELVAVLATDAGPKHIASASLGDRTDVEALSLEDGVIGVDLITHGPEDPLCCPTARERRSYRLVGGSLLPVTAEGEPALRQGHG